MDKIVGYSLQPIYGPDSNTTNCLATGEPIPSRILGDALSLEFVRKLRAEREIKKFLVALSEKIPEYACRHGSSTDYDRKRDYWWLSFNVGVQVVASYDPEVGFGLREPLGEDEEEPDQYDPWSQEPVLVTKDPEEAAQFCTQWVPARYW
jgi:hypothetical protein